MAQLLSNWQWWKKSKVDQAKGQESQAAEGETTPGGDEELEWVVAADNLNPMEAEIIRARLESEGFLAIVRQESLGAVFGLTVGPLGVARVLVPGPEKERAEAILAETFEDDEEPEEE
jgi:hypothetical protein